MNDDSILSTETQLPPRPAGPKPPPQSLDRGTSIGRYVVLEYLGGGGMGVVYAAYDPELDRKIALKLLRAESFADGSREQGQQRLLREAQALAKLSHPNVVGVHDIGVTGSQVFIAMEHIHGRDLSRWLEKEKPPWQKIVDVFLQAGRGLEAAHRAGLLHRDFKPANVLLGFDGRARVADFGLARPTRRVSDSAEDRVDVRAVSAEGTSSVMERQLTRTGSLLGTPAFMAPEQLSGGEVDARSDQFSFCVALYVALYGQPPFDRRKDLRTEELVPPPKGSSVPGWLEKVVRRGLAIDPGDRFSDMGKLLQELDRRPWRRWAWAAGGLSAAALIALTLIRPWQAAPCRGAEGFLAGIWDAPRRAALGQAFSRNDKDYAPALAAGTASLLDAYAERWVAGRQEACEATRIRGEQSETLMDLRIACLDRKLGEMDALVDLLLHAEPTALERGVQAAAQLSSPASCDDTRALTAVVPLPGDPQTRRRVERVRPKVDHLKGLFYLAQADEAWAAAEDLMDEIEQLGYAPLESEAWLAIGLAGSLSNRSEEVIDCHQRGAVLADAGRHDEMRILNLVTLGRYYQTTGSGAEADRWLEMARGALGRFGDTGVWSEYYQVQSVRQTELGEYAEAVRAAQKAVGVSRRFWGEESVQTARHLLALGWAQKNSGELEQALKTFETVSRIQRSHLGESHPEVAYSTFAQGDLLKDLGQYETALNRLDTALEILDVDQGSESFRLIPILTGKGNTLSRLGRLEEAEQLLQEVVDLRRRQHGAEHPLYAAALHDAALVTWNRGDSARARRLLEEAWQVLARTAGESHPLTLIARLNLGRSLLEEGFAQGALGHLGPNLKAALEVHAEDHPTSIGCRLALGEARLALGRARKGADDIQAAAGLAEARAAEPWLTALIRFAQARSAWALGDRDAALQRAEEAEQLFLSLEGAGRHNLSRLRAWVRKTLGGQGP